MEEDQIEDVPVSPLLSRRKANPYGSVPGLDDEELADPAELERQVYVAEFGPLWLIPVQRRKRSGIRPNIDEDGRVDWGAFGTVDFERTRPAFSKARYKADILREEVRNKVIMLSTVGQRLPRMAMYRVLKYVRLGVVDLDDIASEDMRAVARLYLGIRRLQQQIRELGGRPLGRKEIAVLLR